MKKFLLIISLLCLPFTVSAETLTGNVSFDWCQKSQLERDESIQNIGKLLFADDFVKKYPKSEFRTLYKDFLKDSEHVSHYMDVKDGIKENSDEYLAGFYKAGNSILIMYAVQYKSDIMKVYYYDAMGNLRYIDYRSENYPNFPYYTRQYNVNGNLIGTIYFLNHETQYVYKPNQSFKGVWFKDSMFNKNGKLILTRSNYY